jgi:hypothetical protein
MVDYPAKADRHGDSKVFRLVMLYDMSEVPFFLERLQDAIYHLACNSERGLVDQNEIP